jgi:antitoxin component HigA of HigAB toxin-antitoxin module
MYRNVKAEMVRQGLQLKDISEALGKKVPTVSLKLNGKYPLTLDEAKKIKKVLKSDLPLETLFEEVG